MSDPLPKERQTAIVLVGMLAGMFVSLLTSSSVQIAMPTTIVELNGGQHAYTWALASSMLAMTVSIPLWGKLADIVRVESLVQASFSLFIFGVASGGLSVSPWGLIFSRFIEGVGVGGLAILSYIVIAKLVPPRQRGKYSGYFAVVFAVATISGPLLGGVIADTAWLGWRWCFFVGIPFALGAQIMLKRSLRLSRGRRVARIDWVGAFLLSTAIISLLAWMTLLGETYAFSSWQTTVLLGGSLLLAASFVMWQTRAIEPIIPLHLFRNLTVALTTLASFFVGVVQMAAPAFLSQYFQFAMGVSPSISGLLVTPLIVGLVITTTVSGRLITRTGRWKRWLVMGGVLMTIGLGMLASTSITASYIGTCAAIAVLGSGVGMVMQNLVLVAQNEVATGDLGAVSSLVTFFRSLGGVVGVGALGAVLATRVADHLRTGLAGADGGVAVEGGRNSAHALPNPAHLTEPLSSVVQAAYMEGMADMYGIAVPAAVIAVLLIVSIREIPLKASFAPSKSD